MATRRTPRPNVTKSYKNTCGAPAPKASLKKGSNPTGVKSASAKSKKTSSSIHVGGDLVYTIKGSTLSPGSVSVFVPFDLLANINEINCDSGAVAAEMGELSFFVQPAKSFLCAKSVLILGSRGMKNTFHLNALRASWKRGAMLYMFVYL